MFIFSSRLFEFSKLFILSMINKVISFDKERLQEFIVEAILNLEIYFFYFLCSLCIKMKYFKTLNFMYKRNVYKYIKLIIKIFLAIINILIIIK